jgi:hypothetical protein
MNVLQAEMTALRTAEREMLQQLSSSQSQTFTQQNKLTSVLKDMEQNRKEATTLTEDLQKARSELLAITKARHSLVAKNEALHKENARVVAELETSKAVVSSLRRQIEELTNTAEATDSTSSSSSGQTDDFRAPAMTPTKKKPFGRVNTNQAVSSASSSSASTDPQPPPAYTNSGENSNPQTMVSPNKFGLKSPTRKKKGIPESPRSSRALFSALSAFRRPISVNRTPNKGF